MGALAVAVIAIVGLSACSSGMETTEGPAAAAPKSGKLTIEIGRASCRERVF